MLGYFTGCRLLSSVLNPFNWPMGALHEVQATRALHRIASMRSSLWSDGVRVRFRVRFQAVKVPMFSGFPVENSTKKANRLKALLRRISLSEYGSERFRVRLRRLSEYGSVACLVERPKRETRAEQYSDTVLSGPKSWKSSPWTGKSLGVGFCQAPPSYGSGRYRFGVWGPGLHSVRQVLCGGASRLFLDHFSKHLSSVLGRTELCHEIRNPGPQKPQNIRNENHHLALLGFGRTDVSRIFIFEPLVFFADFLAGFSHRYYGKRCPEKSSRKIPGKILQKLYNKNPRHISAEGPGQDLGDTQKGASLKGVLHKSAFCAFLPISVQICAFYSL